MPRPSIILRLVGFAVAAGLAMAGVQPVIAAEAGSVDLRWALGLTGPSLVTAALVFGAARVINRGDALQPPWYSAWLLLPGSFLLAGAAAMCIFGAGRGAIDSANDVGAARRRRVVMGRGDGAGARAFALART